MSYFSVSADIPLIQSYHHYLGINSTHELERLKNNLGVVLTDSELGRG